MKIDEAQPHRGSKELNEGPTAQAQRGHDEGCKTIVSGNHPHMTHDGSDDMVDDSDDGHSQPHRGNEGTPKGPLDRLTMTL